MIKTIYLHDIAVKLNLDKVLTFRPLGKQARTFITSEIDKMMPGECIELNFSGIETCDVSFVDETVVEVQLFLREKRENVLLFLTKFNQDILDNLNGAIRVRESNGIKIPVLIKESERFRYMGPLEPVLAETLIFMGARAQTVASDIAGQEGTAINAASNRLKKLYDLRLCLRDERIDENGKQYVYKLPI